MESPGDSWPLWDRNPPSTARTCPVTNEDASEQSQRAPSATSTGAAKAVGEVLPELKGRLDGIASRVPVPDGSVVDLFVELDREVSVDTVHEVLRNAANSDRMRGVLEFTEEPIVSSDIIGNPHSSIFDASFTQVCGGRFLKALSWYDNEWGYSNRVCDVLGIMAELD